VASEIPSGKTTQGGATSEMVGAGGGKKKKVGSQKAPNKLTQEEIMNDFIKKQFGGA
jgi:hypothetical protein